MATDTTTALLLAIVPAAAALAGVAISGMIEVVKTRNQFAREKQWSGIDDRTRRLEEVYVAASTTEQAASSYVLLVIMGFATGKVEGIKVDPYPRGQLAMLVGLHLPELREEWGRYDEVVQAVLSAVATALLSISGRQEEKTAAVTAMMKAYLKIVPAQREFESGVRKLADSLMTDRLRVLNP